MTRQDSPNDNRLKPYLSPLSAWALAFGCSVGWGAFVMPGSTFLPLAGPIGTLIGMLAGGLVILFIGINYHYMMNRYPVCGGSFTYAGQELDHDHGFLSAWFLLLVYMAIIWANATAIPLIVRYLFPGVLERGPYYEIAGFSVYLAESLFSALMILLAGLICYRGGRLSAILQTLFALILFCGIAGCAAGIFLGGGHNALPMTPAFAPARAPLGQILRIVALGPWAYVGFESISHSTEEFRFPVRRSLGIFALALLTGFISYSLLSCIAVSALPQDVHSWPDYLATLNLREGIEGLPTFHAVVAHMGSTGFLILGLAVGAGILTGLIGNLIAGSRLLYAMSRDHVFPGWIGQLDDRGIPTRAILIITLLSLPIPFFGRTAIGWIVDVNTIGATIAYGYTSFCALRRAKKDGSRLYRFTGAVGFVISIIFTVYFLIPNLWSADTLSPNSYMILILWSILGILFFYYILQRDEKRRFGKAAGVWLFLLFLIFFVSMLWFRETSDRASEEVLHQLDQYHTELLAGHDVALTEEEASDLQVYLEESIRSVESSLLRDSIIQMTIIFIALIILFQIYRQMQVRERRMEMEKLRAESNSRAKSAFLSNMSHDLRTPMNAIIGYTEITRSIGGLPAEAQENLDKVDYSCRHLLTLINDILDLGRIENGRTELDIEPADLKQILEEVRVIFEPQMKAKEIRFRIEDDGITDRYVLCDTSRLNRILLNLVSNAHKYTQASGEVLVACRQNGSEEGTGHYEIRVKDNGMGMDPEFAETVFDAYTREDAASKIQGTGLGMAITKSLIDLMGGNIRVETAKGKGTEFIIDLDLPITDAAQYEKLHKPAPAQKKADFSEVRILLVEDQEINRQIETKILSRAGFRIEYAENGRVAVDKISASEPGYYQIVLMDINMPEMNGYEAAQAIRALPDPALSSVPIVAMTANAFHEDIQKAHDCGMNDHIAKPIEIPRMMEVLTRILGSS